jgi:hypothetical protein
MNKLLTHAKTMINPPPERMTWCYKRWQPLFSEMQQTIKNILFVKSMLNGCCKTTCSGDGGGGVGGGGYA